MLILRILLLETTFRLANVCASANIYELNLACQEK